MNKQLNYYKKNKINPVFIETQGIKWTKHLNTRNNLYENHLKIPVSWFDGKKILEFGPNGGENSLILASYGARINLVEPHELIHKRIFDLYKEASLQKSLININLSLLENYEDNRLYDAVIAEGFIHALPDRLEVIRKLCQFSSNFVIFTYNEKSGYFFESLKRLVFHRLIDINNIEKNDWDKTIELAHKVFFSSFKKLNSARTFESWVKDVLINPCLTSDSCDSFDKISSIFDNLDFEYYSGSPAWDSRQNYKWYKDISNNSINKEYQNNLPFFVTGNKNEQIKDNSYQLILLMTDYFLDYSSELKKFSDIIDFPKFDISEWQYGSDINNLLDYLKSGDSEKIINYYLQSTISNIWGMPHHYVCLKKQS